MASCILLVMRLCALIAYVFFVRTVHRLFHNRWNQQQRNGVVQAKLQGLVGYLFPGLNYLWAGPHILSQNHIRGIPLAIVTPETCFIHFSSEEHVRQLVEAPEEQLSLHALSKDMFQPKYTMSGLEIHDKMNANGCFHTKVFRNVLPSNLPALQLPLAEVVSTTFDQLFAQGHHVGKGWVEVPSFRMAKQVIAAANSLVFFGPDLSVIPGFVEAALQYPEDLFRTAEVLRITPDLIHSLIAPALMRNHKASKFLTRHLTPVVEHRLRMARSRGNDFDADVESQASTVRDCIQFFVDANVRKQEWDAQKIVQVLLGTWFAAVHQPALTMVYALEDICTHPEYIQQLRDELTFFCNPFLGMEKLASANGSLEDAPLLDAILKESARLHPSDSISIRRKVLEPFTFADGTHILAGDVACVPSQAMMRDERIYSNPTIFYPERHITITAGDHGTARLETKTRFTDTDMAFPLWGLGRHSCPGRFYASFLLKLFISYLLTHYDIKLLPRVESQTFTFRSSILPKQKSSLLFRKRFRASIE